MQSKTTAEPRVGVTGDHSHIRPGNDPARAGSEPDPNSQELNVLLIACFDGRNALAISDHILAIERYSKHRVRIYNHYPALAAGDKDLPARLDLRRFDAILIHYSLYVLNEPVDYISAAAKQRIARFSGVKALFRQDEYNHVNGLTAVLSELGVDILFTNFLASEARRVYPEQRLPKLHLVSNFTGYVADNFLARTGPPIAERGIDVGYRSRELPFWLGRLGLEKSQIAIGFERVAREHGLVTDISIKESDRIYGEAWPAFLADCRAVLGTETGASVIDFTGEIRKKTDRHVADHPEATFEEVQALYFKDIDGLYRFEQVSPRHFEAACMKTAMILFEGNYSGVLRPWQHYLPLRKDFANAEEVIAALRDHNRMQEIVDRTREEIAENPRYHFRHLVRLVDAAIDDAFARSQRAPVTDGYSESTFERAISVPYLYRSIGLEPITHIALRSELATDPGHPFANAVNPGNEDDAARVAQGQGLPQAFEIILPRTFAVNQVRLIWESAENRALDYVLELWCGTGLAQIKQVSNNAAADAITSIEWCPCNRVVVRVGRFAGEQRIMLQNAEVYGVWQPLGNLPIRRQLRTIWTCLPASIRVRARRWAERLIAFHERPTERRPTGNNQTHIGKGASRRDH